jgi:DNA segregation ATPase FtsK/SpoIIIE, S-DNA-T family
MALMTRTMPSEFPRGAAALRQPRVAARQGTAEEKPAAAQRDRLRDLVALGLVASIALVITALATFDPADPPAACVFPQHPRASNACGLFGSAVATSLYASFGFAAWPLVALASALAVVLLRRKHLADLPLRAAGGVVAVAAIAVLLAMLLPDWMPRPLWGPGGYAGATGRMLLEGTFAWTGGVILASAVAAAGVFLAFDVFVVRMLASVEAAFTTALTALRERRAAVRGAAREAAEADDAKGGEPASSRRGRLGLFGWKRSAGQALAEDAADQTDEGDEEAADDHQPLIRVRRREVAADDSEVFEAEVDETLDSDLVDEVEEDGFDEDDDAEASEDAVEEEDRQVPIKSRASRRAAKGSSIGPELVPEGRYQLPSLDLLLPADNLQLDEQEQEVRERARMLEKTFAEFGFNIKVVEIETGPVISQYEIELEAGLRLSKITSLADDLAIALRVPSVRIVAPIPGKNSVGIEVPNTTRQMVRLREVIEETASKSRAMKVPVYLGKDVAGNPMAMDLATMPHLLIAGRTGTGKSVCLNSIITSILMSRRPDEVRMLMIDPKMVELTPYKKLPHLMHPVVTDMKKAEAILAWAVEKMEQRYALLASAGVRHISKYNDLGREEVLRRINPASDEEAEQIPEKIPFIVVIADEIADMMMTAGKEIEQHIIRLAQKSRAVGIHLVLATQKPTVDVITGLIKSNLPARIAFQVASRTDSRVVLDEGGADKLLGNGDMLFLYPGTSTIMRGQGTFVSDEEINDVMAVIGTDAPQYSQELVNLKPAGEDDDGPEAGSIKPRDELYKQAVEVIIREGRGSVSLLQRALGIGYGRGARLIDFMAEDGIVGEYNGSQAREVLMTLEQWTAACGESPPPADAPPRKLRIQPHAEELSEDDDEELNDDAADEDDTDGDEAEGDDELSGEDDAEEGDVEYEEEEEDEEGYEDDESADDDGEWEDDDASAEQ